ncbi:MAG: dipeptidyl carboxypeptidase II [Gammaproteobacteria bacterium]|nr:dipeptidyl carboxypeptidase II [Gammaproteobacteria bacterium]
MKIQFLSLAALTAVLVGCSEPQKSSADDPFSGQLIGSAMSENITSPSTVTNPLFKASPLPLDYPQFDLIQTEHYLPAFDRGMAEQLTEIEAIANQVEAPGFDNTIVALERSGQLLDRVSRIFFSMASAHTNDEIRSLQQQLAPLLASHNDAILLNSALFARIKILFDQRQSLSLDPEAQRLLELYHLDFVRAGAALTGLQQERMREINADMAIMQTLYSQNVLSEANDLAIIVDSEEEMQGIDDALKQAASEEAAERDIPGKYVIPLLNTSGQPVLASLQNRSIRKRIFETSLSRGSRGGDFDNRDVLSKILTLRAERAELLGFANHAEFILANQTAQTVDVVNRRLAELAAPAVVNVRREANDLQAMIESEGADFQLAAWDWDFYAEKLRSERFDFDANQLRPYFELENVLQRGVFYAAERLFGIHFEERDDLPVYQEDVRVFEVIDVGGTTLGMFIADFYARPSKRGGAWMNSYVSQSELMGTRPVVANHLNITAPPAGEPTLLTFDEVTTMFHEFGHALHGLFSAVKFPYFSGTSVPRDFVEYPSQVNEIWAIWPEVLENYAVHYESGEAMPRTLLEKVVSSQTFNQGFATTEYLAASIVDQALHQLTVDEVPAADLIMAFEEQALGAAGIQVDEVPPRYRATYFSHIAGGYSASYYSYIWSEVLDADTAEWFYDNGGLQRENGDRFRRSLLSQGGSKDAMSLYRSFRGRDAQILPLLERRGLN